MRKPFYTISAVLLVVLFLASPTLAAFTDVNGATSYQQAILYAQEHSIVKGYNDGTFHPQQNINRAEFVKIMVAAVLNYDPAKDPAGFDIYSLAGLKFTDVESKQWYIPYLRKAVAQGMIAGYPDGTFHPESPVSFAEAAKIIVKAFGYPTSTDPVWYKPFVDKLASVKAIPASIKNFTSQLTRAEMVEMIYRLQQNITSQPSLSYDGLAHKNETKGPKVSSSSNCPVFPADNPWNKNIAGAPLDANSNAYIESIGKAKFLHPDFGGGGEYGIPYVVVGASQPKIPLEVVDYPDESDAGPYPIPPNAPVENGSDAHVIAVDGSNCLLYELFGSSFTGKSWQAGSAAKFDLNSNALRPDGWTSADAAGLPIFAGLVRYDEVEAGAINHALRFTVSKTQKGYIHPATHAASSSTDSARPPMGLRLRLRADFDTSKFHGAAKIILEALKQYGMIVADNGSDWFMSGAQDPRWDDDDLGQLKNVPGSAFEVVQSGPILK